MINLKKLMTDYMPNPDTNQCSDEELQLYNKINKLSDPEKIILFLYAELQSYRKLANELNVSFTTAYKEMNRIRNKILTPDNKNDDDASNIND